VSAVKPVQRKDLAVPPAPVENMANAKGNNRKMTTNIWKSSSVGTMSLFNYNIMSYMKPLLDRN